MQKIQLTLGCTIVAKDSIKRIIRNKTSGGGVLRDTLRDTCEEQQLKLLPGMTATLTERGPSSMGSRITKLYVYLAFPPKNRNGELLLSTRTNNQMKHLTDSYYQT